MTIHASVQLTYGCNSKLTDGDIYTTAHPEGFCEDKSGEYWPNGEFDAPSIRYCVAIEVTSSHALLRTGVASWVGYEGETLQLPVENYNSDRDLWHVVG